MRGLLSAVGCGLVAACLVGIAGSPLTAQESPQGEVDVRLRIAWGGAERTTWSGSISVDRGRFDQLTPLGIEHDEPGCVWLEENVVHIEEQSRRDYGGVDVSLVAPADARLVVRLRSGVAESEVTTETDLGKLVSTEHRATLDASGNYVLIARAPGDRMRVQVDREHLIYAPGQTLELKLRVSPELLVEYEAWQLVAEVARARGGTVLHTQKSLVTRGELEERFLAVTLPTPAEEGVYEARLSLRKRPGITQRLVPTAGTSTLVQRHLQFVVFDSFAARIQPALEWEPVASIDLANPNWSARVPTWFPLESLPGAPNRPASNVPHATGEIAGKSALILPPPSSAADRPWYAIPAAVPSADLPYLISLEVPPDRITQLGLTILEPNAAGFVYPVTRDFGVFSAGDSTSTTDGWLTKQFLFWPKTTSPMLLLTNEHPHEAAHVGVVRIFRAGVGQSTPTEMLPSLNQRTAAVLIERPWLPESTGARELLDTANRQSVDDWQTFYDAAMRLVDYVQLAGYNAAVLTALADGSAIYPSAILHSTPRYDTGVLATTALDPLRKDFLELILSFFDRADLSLYVGLEFSTPLPELERLRREADPQQSGVEWIGADGRRWAAGGRSGDGHAGPRYNLLHPQVQDAVLDVVREIVSRYDAHPSLEGLALQLSGTGYAQLLEPQWGLDDATVGRFEEETGIAVPGSGPERFAVRGRFLTGPKRKEWIAWRADVVTRFYARICDVLRAGAEHRELWILPARLIERSEVRARLRPSPAVADGLTQILLEMGIDTEALADQEGIALLPPTFVTPPAPVAAIAAEIQVNAANELEPSPAPARGLGHAVYYPSLTRNRRLLSFDQRGFFGENRSFTAPLTQMRPLGAERGRALARALASHDPSIFIEGGQTLVTELDHDLHRSLEIFRKLPTEGKRTVSREQPITVRTYHTGVDSFVCVVNESPWPHTVGVVLEAPAGAQLLEIGTPSPPQTVPVEPARTEWRVDLEGFGIYAARISTPSARVVKMHVEPSAIMQNELARRIDELDAWRLSAQADPSSLLTSNAGFEAGEAEPPIAGWRVIGPEGAAVVDTEDTQEGEHCLRITSTGPPVSVVSDPFTTPAMGRLSVSAYVRRDDESADLEVLMIIEDAQGGVLYRKGGRIGGSDPKRVPPIPVRWGARPFSYSAEGVPLEVAGPIRVRFVVSGAGTVWIDQIGVRHDNLGEQQRELAKIIYEAQVALRDEAYSDCLECLEGFWPRYVAAQPRVSWESDPPSSAAPEIATPNEPDLEPQGVAERIKQMVPRIFRQ